MKKVLLPTDFSKNAKNAAVFALSLFKNDKCEFYLLNTYQIPLSVAKGVISYNDILRKRSFKKLQKWKEVLTKKLQNPQHVIETVSNLGNPVNVIRRRVLKDKFDILIIASRIENGSEETTKECILSNVIKNVNCPTIIVPEKTNFHIPTHILFVFDLDSKETKAKMESMFSQLIKIAKQYKSFIYILYFSKRNKKNDTEKSRDCHELGFYFQGITHQFYFAENDYTSDYIENFIRKHTVDMVAMYSKDFSGFKHIFQYINESSTRIPILFLPDAYSKINY